ncbi:hypothetical protein HQ585_13725 [candidate division KSB1 bacterium]|nr:hypothetical protein [candidate division KSB1 bacterium]
MNYEPLTVDEFAMLERANGTNVIKIDDIWWTEVKPFFFRPLLPFREINPIFNKIPLKFLIGGYQHVVDSRIHSNSTMSFFAFDDIQNYSFDNLSSSRRNVIRRSLKNFSAKQMKDEKEFVNDAFKVYVSFYERTKYYYNKKRINKSYFSAWAEILFKFPKLMIIGTYHQDKLSAVSISFLIDENIIDATFFSDTQSQKMQVTDFILHTIRETASHSDAKYILRGMPSGKEGLDNAKLTRGCRLIKKPAYYKINPITSLGLKLFMKNSFTKIEVDD